MLLQVQLAGELDEGEVVAVVEVAAGYHALDVSKKGGGGLAGFVHGRGTGAGRVQGGDGRAG